MHFESMNAFWSMDGYGLYVWLSFAASGLSIGLLWFDSIATKTSLLKQALVEQARQARIAAAKGDTLTEREI
jgi:heme exporter protein CcmD